MAEQFPQLTEGLIKFIEKQRIFFTGTARASGNVNVSPKGSDSLRIINQNQLIWQNLTGSGNETAAHLLENNRMTLMFCSFEKKPLILRLYGSASAIHPNDNGWADCLALFPDNIGTRQFYLMDIELVQTSCGFAVPFMDFVSHRDTLDIWAEKKGKEGIGKYWEENNRLSIDGFETGIFESKS